MPYADEGRHGGGRGRHAGDRSIGLVYPFSVHLQRGRNHVEFDAMKATSLIILIIDLALLALGLVLVIRGFHLNAMQGWGVTIIVVQLFPTDGYFKDDKK